MGLTFGKDVTVPDAAPGERSRGVERLASAATPKHCAGAGVFRPRGYGVPRPKTLASLTTRTLDQRKKFEDNTGEMCGK